jgi:hypothetical protein
MRVHRAGTERAERTRGEHGMIGQFRDRELDHGNCVFD